MLLCSLDNLLQDCFSPNQLQHVIFHMVVVLREVHMHLCIMGGARGGGKDVHYTSAAITTSRAYGVHLHSNANLAVWLRDLREGLKLAAKADQQQQQWQRDQSVELRRNQQDDRLYASSSMPLDRLPSITLSVSPRQSLQRGK